MHHLALPVLFFGITNFLKSLFSFVKEALALGYLSKSWTFLLLVVTEANDFPSSGTLSSSFLLKNLCFSWSFYTRFHSFIICRVFKFSYLGGQCMLSRKRRHPAPQSHFYFKLLLAFLLFYSGAWSL